MSVLSFVVKYVLWAFRIIGSRIAIENNKNRR